MQICEFCDHGDLECHKFRAKFSWVVILIGTFLIEEIKSLNQQPNGECLFLSQGLRVQSFRAQKSHEKSLGS